MKRRTMQSRNPVSSRGSHILSDLCIGILLWTIVATIVVEGFRCRSELSLLFLFVIGIPFLWDKNM